MVYHTSFISLQKKFQLCTSLVLSMGTPFSYVTIKEKFYDNRLGRYTHQTT